MGRVKQQAFIFEIARVDSALEKSVNEKSRVGQVNLKYGLVVTAIVALFVFSSSSSSKVRMFVGSQLFGFSTFVIR